MTYALLLHALGDPPGDDTPRRVERVGRIARSDGSDAVSHGAAETTGSAMERAVARAIVIRLRQGDPAALAELMRLYVDRMGRLSTHILGSRDAAEDVVQDVFVRVWEGRATLDPELSIQAFLLTAVRHRALNDRKYERVRERYRDDRRDMAEPVGAGESTSVSDGTTSPHGDAEIDALIAALPERQQTAVRLRFVEQLSVPDVAQVLGISPNAAHQLIFRALETLRRTVRIRP